MNKMKIFSKDATLTANRVSERLERLRQASDFKCEEEKHRKARYALFKNLDRYERAVKVIEDMMEDPSDKVGEFQREKFQLAKRCGGIERSMPNGGTTIDSIKDTDRFTRELIKLEEKYAKALKEDEARIKRNQALGETEIEDEPEAFMAQEEWFPNELTPKQLSGISFMLKDPEETKSEKDG